jgi:hypothetical protein
MRDPIDPVMVSRLRVPSAEICTGSIFAPASILSLAFSSSKMASAMAVR